MNVLTAKDVAMAVGDPPHVDNVSLLYDKFSPVGDGHVREKAIERLITAKPSTMPRPAIAELLQQHGVSVGRFRARLAARMMVDMAGGVQENAGLCLDRHFGTPFIPGTALKGLTLRAAIEERGNDTDPDIVAVFGEQNDSKSVSAKKGKVSFLAAYPTAPAPLEMDVITCHHPAYYRGEMPVALDNEDPKPVKFPSVKAGVEFEFAVVGKDSALVDKARRWLLRAVTDHGVGAKTSAGYGWFQYDEEEDIRRAAQEEQQREKEEKERQLAEEEARRLAAMTVEERIVEQLCKHDDGRLAGMIKTLTGEDEITKKAFLMVMKGPKVGLWKEWKKAKKGKGVERVKLLKKVAAELGEELP